MSSEGWDDQWGPPVGPSIFEDLYFPDKRECRTISGMWAMTPECMNIQWSIWQATKAVDAAAGVRPPVHEVLGLSKRLHRPVSSRALLRPGEGLFGQTSAFGAAAALLIALLIIRSLPGYSDGTST